MHRCRKHIWTGLVVLLIALGMSYVLWGGLEQNLVYFVTPTELQEKGEQAVGNPVRLGGVVARGSVQFANGLLTFAVTDDHTTVAVMTTKAPPQMFQEDMGVVVEGALQGDGRFHADRLMVKHGNEYRPPEQGEMPKEIYRELMHTGTP